MAGTGTDVAVPPNNLMIAHKIRGAWLIQIKEAGRGVMYQFTENLTNISYNSRNIIQLNLLAFVRDHSPNLYFSNSIHSLNDNLRQFTQLKFIYLVLSN